MYATAERKALADALQAAGPDAPTLCAGWQTRDLAAHLVLRERRPDAAAGILLKPLNGYNKKVQDRLAAGDYAALVGKVRSPQALSPLRIGALEEAMNLIEFFVHHEDVRRAGGDHTPRDLPPGYADALRKRVRGTARLSARRFPATIVVQPAGSGPFEVGAGGERVEVGGDPGELIMFFTGRQSVAQVTVQGPDGLAGKIQNAKLGL
jgi:uncharacterized protein (TIGR03085 family)